MTIKTDAQAIRAETVAKANTAERVGKCLEDIADDLVAKQAEIDGILSKAANSSVCHISMAGNGTTTTPADTNTWTKVLGSTTLRLESGSLLATGHGNNRIVHAGVDALVINIAASVTVMCSSGSRIIEVGILKNGSIVTGSIGRSSIIDADEPTQICANAVIGLAADDYIEVGIRAVEFAEAYSVPNLNLTAHVVGI